MKMVINNFMCFFASLAMIGQCFLPAFAEEAIEIKDVIAEERVEEVEKADNEISIQKKLDEESQEEMKKQDDSEIEETIKVENEITSGTCGDNLTWILNEEGLLTISGTGEMEDYWSIAASPWRNLTVKEVMIENGVTSISRGSFQDCEDLQKITIANTVTSIGGCAFAECSSLTSIRIPEGVTSIREASFFDCSGLKSITIPTSVTSIEHDAFAGCSSLTSITIPESVKNIDEYAFVDCSSLKSITISASVTNIEDFAFYRCNSLASIVVNKDNPVYDSRENCNAIIDTKSNTLIFGCKNTIIPESVTSIGEYAFYKNSSLTSITIPEGVTSIGTSFCGCSGLKSITIPSSVMSIEMGAFSACSSLTNMAVEKNNPVYDSRNNCNAIIDTKSNTLIFGCKNTIIPESVTSIGDWAFNGCSNLTSITIPEGVTSIGEAAFGYCSSLTSITIPEGVTSIGDYAFESCDNLTDVYYAGTKEEWNNIYIGSDNDSLLNANIIFREIINSGTCGDNLTWILDEEGLLTISGTGEMEDYWSEEYWSFAVSPWSNLAVKEVMIEKGITSIGDGSFRKCEDLRKITIADTVTSIGESAFEDCSSLISITIPASVTSIGLMFLQNVAV